MIRMIWHLVVRGHSIRVNLSISVPSFDPSARGWLYTCECGEGWAR